LTTIQKILKNLLKCLNKALLERVMNSNKKVVMVDHSEEKSKKNFIVNWCMGNQCNYRCGYCINELNDGSCKWPEPDIVRNICTTLINHYQKKLNKKLIFELTGGEITLYKDLYNILLFLKENECKTQIFSNSSPPLSYWEKIKEVLDSVVLSYHVERCNPEHFFLVTKYLSKHILVHINVMMHPIFFDKCKDLSLKIINSLDKVSVGIQPLLTSLKIGAGLMKYSKKQWKIMKELQASVKTSSDIQGKRHRGAMMTYYNNGRKQNILSVDYLSEQSNNWFGWLCWAGLEHIIIDKEGNIFRAWCLQDFIGHINNPDQIEFPTHPVMCQRKQCNCNLDTLTKKQKPIYLTSKNIKQVTALNLI